jgi:CubicO group peptidase (beta-lactamase class C family)
LKIMDARSAERLFARLDAAAHANRFSGVVAVRLDADLGFERAYGYADRANGLANTMQTRFATASATKAFTALAVCALMEEGRLAPDASLIDLLDVSLPHISRAVTIEHLLTHTSGVGDYYDEDVVADFTDYHLPIPWYRLERPQDYLPLLAELPPKFPPGARFSYSNSGFILLGLVVEHLARVPYHEFVQARIFDRAHMSQTGFFRLDQLPERTALGYVDAADGSWRTNVYSLPVVGGPDGGAFCTAADMRSFWSALHGDLIVGREWRDRFLRSRVSAGTPGLFYGLGVWIHDRADQPLHFVEGADAGVTFNSLHDGESGTEYTIACNAPPGATEIVKLLDEAILDLEPA